MTFAILSFGQSKVISFKFEGTITSGEEILEEVEVRIFDGNDVISTLYTDKKGKFEIDLMKGSEYVIELSKDDYYTKRMIVKTNVEDGVKKLPKLKFEASLVGSETYADAETEDPEAAGILDFPSAIIEYNKSIGDFDYRMEYTEHIKEKLEDIE